MKKIKLSDGIERTILNISDNCPICGTPLKEVSFRWRMFHGEAESSCCHAIYQIKSWYVDPDKYAQDIVEFSNSLDNPDIIYFKIPDEWIKPLKETLKKTGKRYISDDEVYELAEKLVK